MSYIKLDIHGDSEEVYIRINKTIDVSLISSYLSWEYSDKENTGLIVPAGSLTREDLDNTQSLINLYRVQIENYLSDINTHDILFNISGNWLSTGLFKISNRCIIFFSEGQIRIPKTVFEEFLFEDRQLYEINTLLIEKI